MHEYRTRARKTAGYTACADVGDMIIQHYSQRKHLNMLMGGVLEASIQELVSRSQFAFGDR